MPIEIARAQALTDRDKAHLPATRQLRAQLSPFLILYQSRLNNALPSLPSYIAEPVRQLIAALPQWESDERADTSGQPCGCDVGTGWVCERHRG